VTIKIKRAVPEDAADVAGLVGELLQEIMRTAGVQAFHFDLAETTVRVNDFLQQHTYIVFLACVDPEPTNAGVITLCESHALYAEGSFGIIPEFYVRPRFRSAGVGRQLLDAAKEFGLNKGWRRLEVTTPPLPEFERALRFYAREGFSITGGRKLKLTL
jgi:GNAT superfamily N-acetyltransferase